MKKLIRFVVGMVVPAFIVAGGMASSAVAQEKAAQGASTMKVLMENDKVRAYEVTFKPGDVNAGIPSTATRVIHVLQGGTQEYSYADGKKETRVRKTGEVYMGDVGPAYTVKNIGKTVFQVYVVQVK